MEGGYFRLREGNAVHIGEFKCTEYVINTVFIILRIDQSILGTRKVSWGQKDDQTTDSRISYDET